MKARRVAEHPAKHPKVAKVYYATLFEDAGRIRIRDEQSIRLKGGQAAAGRTEGLVRIREDGPGASRRGLGGKNRHERMLLAIGDVSSAKTGDDHAILAEHR